MNKGIFIPVNDQTVRNDIIFYQVISETTFADKNGFSEAFLENI